MVPQKKSLVEPKKLDGRVLQWDLDPGFSCLAVEQARRTGEQGADASVPSREPRGLQEFSMLADLS